MDVEIVLRNKEKYLKFFHSSHAQRFSVREAKEFKIP